MIERRSFLSAVGALAGRQVLWASPASAASPDRDVHFISDGVQEAIDRAEHGRVAAPVGVISIESPVRRKNGEVFPFEELKRICSLARDKGIRLHLDGARMFLAAPYTGVTPAQYSSLFDTV